jgi:hypothetical protein
VNIHPNDKAAQIKLMRKNIRRLQSHQKNPAVIDAMARSALETALARIEELEAEVARLTEPPTVFMACQSHRLHSYTVRGVATASTPTKQVCPICAGIAEQVSGPSL